MDCPNCGAAMQLDKGMDSWSCIYCKTVYHSEANDEGVHVLSDASSFTCPLCSLPLAQAAMDGHKLYYCTRCHGILIAVPVFVVPAGPVARETGRGMDHPASGRPKRVAAPDQVPAMPFARRDDSCGAANPGCRPPFRWPPRSSVGAPFAACRYVGQTPWSASLVCAGPPGPALLLDESRPWAAATADEGVGRGPGEPPRGPPHD